MRERLGEVFAGGDPRLRRLSAAGTSVNLQITDAPQSSVTVLLDRQPPSLAGGDEPAEITIELTARQGVLFASGLLPVPSAMLGGELPYRGPVRKYSRSIRCCEASWRRSKRTTWVADRSRSQKDEPTRHTVRTGYNGTAVDAASSVDASLEESWP